MRFIPEGAGTRVELDGDYRLPLGPIGTTIDALARGAGDRSASDELRRFAQLLQGLT